MPYGNFRSEKDLFSALQSCALSLNEDLAGKPSADLERQNWCVDAGVANSIARLAYNDPALSALTSAPGVNDGALAILDSIKYYINGEVLSLRENTRRLMRAFEYTESDFSRNVILGRILVNGNLLSDGKIASEYMKKIDFGSIQDPNLVATLLDYTATLTFNSVAPQDFITFKGADIRKIIDAWELIGVYIDDVDGDREVIENYGLHIFTVQQLRHFSECSESEGAAVSTDRFRVSRQQMVEDFTKSVRLSSKTPQRLNIAKDFFGSLQRPAFHALICKDYAHLEYILDIYHGRNGEGDLPILNQARSHILKSGGLNRQWMSLLNIASKYVNGRRDDAVLDFQRFSEVFKLRKKTKRIKNQNLLKAIPYVAEGLGLGGQSLNENDGAIKSARLSNNELHRSYLQGIVDAMMEN